MIKGKGGNKYAQGSVKTLKLTLDTHNKIFREPIQEMSAKLEKRVERKLKYVIGLLENQDLLDMTNGGGQKSYDGYGFDYLTRELDFFWYFSNTPYGDRQLVKAIRKILKLDLEFMAKDMTLTLNVTTHPM